jgi:L-ascorbate metabolism protein UlaG (beta-lactamase superfamily)
MPKLNAELVYLKRSTRIEPLACRWWAWSHLVAPVQQAMNIAFRQVPLLRSFVEDYEIHALTSEDPRLLGGPYVHLRVADLPAVKMLLEDTVSRCRHLIRLAEDVVALDHKLEREARGFSLEGFHAELPASLSGVVEMSYDLNNHPRIRVFEELLYDAALNRTTQEVAFSSMKDEQRDFFLNTPRLDGTDRIVAPMAFDHSFFDVISEGRLRPVELGGLMDAMGIPARHHERFRRFFTSEAPRRNSPQHDGDGVRVRYFGHACVLVQTRAVSILVDPYLAWDEESEATLTFADLPDHIDYVCITHAHQDHCCPEVLLQLRGRVGAVIVPRNNPLSLADPSLKLVLRALGFANVAVLDPLDCVSFPEGQLTALPFLGEHCGLDVQSKQAFFLELQNRKLLFLADSAGLEPMLYHRLSRWICDVDALFIGMECRGAPLTWLYGPYLTKPVSRKDDESRRLSGSDCEQAWAIVQSIHAKRAYVYAMGQEPWLKFMMGLQYQPDSVQIVESDRFVEKCRQAGIEAQRLYGTKEIVL